MASIDLDPVRAHVEILRYVKRKKAELKELEGPSRDAVEEYMGNATEGLLDDEPAIKWHSYKRRALDQEALKEHHPELHEAYVSASEVRRFEVAGE